MCEGTYTPELASQLKGRLSEVFNRGFWDGYYQGAKMGQWSEVYGSQSKLRKVYVGKVSNWFDRIGVCEITVESQPLCKGDRAMAIGQTTGVVEFEIEDMRVNFQSVDRADKGVRCSVAVPGKLHRGDKIYKWAEAE